MSYPKPDIASLPTQARTIIHSLPPNIKLETIQDELHKQGFAVISSTLVNTSHIYIPNASTSVSAVSINQYPKEEHPKKQKKSKCSIQ